MGNFSKQIKEWVEKAKSNTEKVVKYSAGELGTRIIKRNPFDTGRSRANWQTSFNYVPLSSLIAYDKMGGKTIIKTKEQLEDFKIGDKIYFINNVEYVIGLEYGASQQAPAGMVRISVNEFDSIVREAGRKVAK